jgi:xylan 1,4-beta-xylosidase
VGGPASAGGAWIPEFIAFCQDHHVPVDFVASHSYGVVQGFVDVDGKKSLVLDPNPDSIVGDVKGMRDRIIASPLPTLPLYVTEWSTSYSARDPVHDSYVSAPYILDRVKRSGSAAECMSYWTFSDQFEENGQVPSPFHGGFGLLNAQGLPKPAFFVYRFLNQLGNLELNCDDQNSWVCRDDHGVQVLFWNYTQLHQDAPNQKFFTRDLPARRARDAKIKIDGLPAGNYVVRVTRVGYRHNDVYTAYLLMGKPERTDAHAMIAAGDLEKLKAECSGFPSLERTISVTAGQPAELDLEMKQNDVCFVTISR